MANGRKLSPEAKKKSNIQAHSQRRMNITHVRCFNDVMIAYVIQKMGSSRRSSTRIVEGSEEDKQKTSNQVWSEWGITESDRGLRNHRNNLTVRNLPGEWSFNEFHPWTIRKTTLANFWNNQPEFTIGCARIVGVAFGGSGDGFRANPGAWASRRQTVASLENNHRVPHTMDIYLSLE